MSRYELTRVTKTCPYRCLFDDGLSRGCGRYSRLGSRYESLLITIAPSALPSLPLDECRDLPDTVALYVGATESRCKTVVTPRWS